jgi:hypothetical protein
MARLVLCTLLIVTLFAAAGFAADLTDSLKPGKAELKSAGAMTFGPEGILFIGDWLGGTIYAFDTHDRTPSTAGPVDITGINQKIASMLGTTADQIIINDIAANPISKSVYLTVSRGRGPDGVPVIVRANSKGNIEQISLANINHSKVTLTNAPPDRPNTPYGDHDENGRLIPRTKRNNRIYTITDLKFFDGKLYIAGLSNEEFESKLRSVAFPFTDVNVGASIQIFHGDHGRFETDSPVRVFAPYKTKQDQYLLASYSCTPLVKIPVSSLKPGVKVLGTTIAEMGSSNAPIDMVLYTKGGTDYILMANSDRGVMKISLSNLDEYKPITAQVKYSEETAKAGLTGLPYETIKELNGVLHLDKFDEKSAIVLAQAKTDSIDLKTVALP